MIAATKSDSTVLVIDDELGPRESIRMVLKNQYKVLCASSVDEGLGLFNSNRPDTVIIDLRMPNKNGITGLREIRSIDPDVSVIILTGYGSLDTAREAIHIGASEYLQKPFDAYELRAIVERQVQRTQRERTRESAETQLTSLRLQLDKEVGEKGTLEEQGKAYSKFAHDLRNALCSIQGYTEILRSELQKTTIVETTSTSMLTDCLHAITDSVSRSGELLRTVQGMRKTQSEERKVVPIGALFDEVRLAVHPAATQAGVKTEFATPPDNCGVRANRLSLFRVLENLVNNAIQASRPGSQVRLASQRIENKVQITVSDAGCGIAPENLQRIFEPNFTTKKDHGGLGLGLFIVQSAIEDHGGDIQVTSEVNVGTTFTIHLPAC